MDRNDRVKIYDINTLKLELDQIRADFESSVEMYSRMVKVLAARTYDKQNTELLFDMLSNLHQSLELLKGVNSHIARAKELESQFPW